MLYFFSFLNKYSFEIIQLLNFRFSKHFGSPKKPLRNGKQVIVLSLEYIRLFIFNKINNIKYMAI